jgi:hypothetical protein
VVKAGRAGSAGSAGKELRRGGAPGRADLIGDSRESLVDFSSCSDISGARHTRRLASSAAAAVAANRD